MHVHPDHMQTGHGLNSLAHVLLRVGSGPLDRNAVFHDDVEIHGDLFRADLDLDALGDIAVLAHDAAADGAHAGNAFHLVGREARDDGHDFVIVGNVGRGRQILHIRGKGAARLLFRLHCHKIILLFGGVSNP